jgi:autotransporter-associated beta strand protein
MKTIRQNLFLLAGLIFCLRGLGLHAADLTWDTDAIVASGAQDGAGTWTTATSNTNWWNGTANVIWTNTAPDNAIFGAGSGAAGTVTIASSVTNNVGNLTFNAADSGSYTIAGNSSTTSKLNLVGTPNITVANGVSATNTVVLSGTSFVKLGAGTLVFKPAAANVNSGPTTVAGGTLVIGSSNSRLLIPGDLIVTNGATALLGANEQIADTATLTVNGATFDSGGKSETIGGMVVDGVAQILSASSSAAITNNGTAYDFRSGFVYPNLAGTAGLTKTTAGTLVLTNGGGADTFTGPVLISAGILELGHSGVGNGLAATTITVTNTGMLRLGKDTQIQSNSTVNVASGTFELNGHNETVTTVILNNNGFIQNGGNTSKTLTILTNMDFRSGLCASHLAGAGLLTKSTAGTVTLSLDNANTGGVLISAGILQLGDGSSTNRGTFGNGPVTNNAAVVLNHSGAFPLTNTISGSGSLTNLGGSPTLMGTNTYSGGTTVSGGTLFANNTSFSSTGSGAVTVLASATLGGNGIIGGATTVQSSGTLAPGTNSLGTLTISNTLTLGGNTAIEINKGVGFDVVTANSVNYGGTLVVTDLGLNLVLGDPFQIFNAGSHTGNFTSISGSPGAGLAWSFNPANGVLSVVSGSTTQPTLTVAQSGNSLNFSWTDPTFKLQSQTNSLNAGVKTNWSDFPGGGSSPVNVTINPANPTVFFRLSQ